MHRLKGFHVDQIYPASCIHEYSIDIVSFDLSFEYQGRISWWRHYYQVVFSAEFYWLRGPV
jgi:hypothetical protein